MKVRMDFVTNSSTTSFLVVRGRLRGEGLTPEILRGYIEEYMQSEKLKFEYPKEPPEDRIFVEEFDDDFDFTILASIPFHKVINDFKTELERWFDVRGYETNNFEMYIHVECDG